MARIRINYDNLEQNTSSLKNSIESYEELNTRLNNLIEQIRSTWSGKAADSYVEMMRGYQRQARSMIDVLESFMKYANKADNDFAAIDAQCAQKIRNSF
ncbi:MAG: WXG100 family type VII secretion target [Erysipelotrichaceae bacterium]|nr:WXG100 family type VII secretion target [Erysipelotrichaceae bacterium]